MLRRVNVEFFPYNFNGKKGIGCSLGPVQKLRDGEALGGAAPSAAQAFGAPQQAQPQVNPITGQPVVQRTILRSRHEAPKVLT